MKFPLRPRTIHRVSCTRPELNLALLAKNGLFVDLGSFVLDTGSDFTTLPQKRADDLSIHYHFDRPLGFNSKPGIQAYLNTCVARLAKHEFMLPILVTRADESFPSNAKPPTGVIGRAGLIETFEFRITASHIFVRRPWRL